MNKPSTIDHRLSRLKLSYYEPELVEMIARATLLIQELHDLFTQDKAGEALGVSKTTIQYHIKKIKQERGSK